MEYTAKQIETAKANYNAFLQFHTLANYDVNTIGVNTAEQRMDYHNSIIRSILAGNKEVEKEWKMFFLTEVVKSDYKREQQDMKIKENKAASSDILAPIKEAKRIVEFGKWLNTKGNPYRQQHFSKKYTVEAVNSFLSI